MSSTDVTDPRHAAARRHLQSGAIGPARQLFDALLDERPDDPDLLNDAALAYAHDGDAAQAEACLRRALDARPDHEAAFYNLLDLLTGQRDDRAAREVFTTYADRLPDSDDKDRYRERLGNPLPAHQGDGAPVDDRDTDTLRIAFVCGPDRKFITDIEREIGKRHEVRTAYFDGEVNLQQIQHLMDWADVTWFEWCDPILVHASHKLRKTSRVVCRLHSWEAFNDFPRSVSWCFVDHLVVVSEHMGEIIREHLPEIPSETKVEVIHNGVDLERFVYRSRTPGKNLAYVGYINHKKNPSLLLQCFSSLLEVDESYRLHVAGNHQTLRYKLYWNHIIDELGIGNYVIMHGWVDDVAAWLQDKHYLVSSSIHESFGYGIAEAMACGVKPIIHHFMGAERLYSNEFLYLTPSEFVCRITESKYESIDYRTFVAENFNLKKQAQKISNLFQSLVTFDPPNSSSSSSPSPEIFDSGFLRQIINSVVPDSSEPLIPETECLPTVVIPVYDRLKYLDLYMSEGQWDGVPVMLSCDGSSDEFMQDVRLITGEHDNITAHQYASNKGAPVARHRGAKQVDSTLIICCDDDDFFGDAVRFAQECAAIFREENDTLLVANPTMYTLHENGRLEKGYGFDKRRFDGLSGRDLLKKLVKLGEPHGLNNGACYRRSMFLSVPIPPFIFPEDYGYLIRMCTAYPNHIARVANTGTFFRLRSESGITHDITLTKLLETFLYQCEGAMTLIENNEMTRSEFKAIIADRGRQIQKVRGWGQEAFHTFNRLIQGEAPAQFKSDESRATIEFIRSTYPDLPTVYDYFLPQRVRSALNLNNDSHRIALAN